MEAPCGFTDPRKSQTVSSLTIRRAMGEARFITPTHLLRDQFSDASSAPTLLHRLAVAEVRFTTTTMRTARLSS